MKNLYSIYKNLFKKLEIKKDDKIIIHSNLSTFGIYNSRMPKIIIKVLKKTVGSKGAIFMPLYTFGTTSKDLFNKNVIYKNKFTSLLSEIFFYEKKIKRSYCPIHSHIGIGKNSNILLKSNPKNTYGKNSDFDLMMKNNFKLVLLGCSAQEGATYFHQVEAIKNVPYGKWISFKRKLKIKKKIKIIKVNFFEKKKVTHDLNKCLEIISRKSKSFRSVKNRYYKSCIINLKELHNLTSIEIDKNPLFLIKNAK